MIQAFSFRNQGGDFNIFPRQWTASEGEWRPGRLDQSQPEKQTAGAEANISGGFTGPNPSWESLH